MARGGKSFHSVVYLSFINMCNTLILNGRYEEAYAYLVAYATYLGVEVEEDVDNIEREYYKLLKRIMLKLRYIVQSIGIQTESELPENLTE
jgi:hypothetical protein